MFFKRTIALVILAMSCPTWALDKYSASADETRKAIVCVRHPSLEQMEADLSRFYQNSKVETLAAFNLDGFILRNTSRDGVEDLHTLTFRQTAEFPKIVVTADDIRKGEKVRMLQISDIKNGRTFDLSEYQQQMPECANIICASKRIFGDRLGIKILWTYKQFGLNLSRYQFLHGIDFSEIEIDAAMYAIAMFPEHLWPYIANKNAGFFRFRKKSTMAVGADWTTAANSLGAVFDPIDTYKNEHKTYLFVHEMCHRVARLERTYVDKEYREMDELAPWLEAAGWRFIEKRKEFTEVDKYERTKKDGSVSLYSETNPIEDFAEACTAYRLVPSKLKAVSISRYQYMKETVFKGIEYSLDASCQNL